MIIIPHERSAARLNATMQSNFPEPVAVFLDELAVTYANHEPVRGLWAGEGRPEDGAILMLALNDIYTFAQVFARFSDVMTDEERRACDARPVLNAIRFFCMFAARIYKRNAEAAADEAQAA